MSFGAAADIFKGLIFEQLTIITLLAVSILID